jgi:hypothetical protein
LRVIVFHPRQVRMNGGKEQDQLENHDCPPEDSIVTPLPATMTTRDKAHALHCPIPVLLAASAFSLDTPRQMVWLDVLVG